MSRSSKPRGNSQERTRYRRTRSCNSSRPRVDGGLAGFLLILGSGSCNHRSWLDGRACRNTPVLRGCHRTRCPRHLRARAALPKHLSNAVPERRPCRHNGCFILIGTSKKKRATAWRKCLARFYLCGCQVRPLRMSGSTTAISSANPVQCQVRHPELQALFS